MCSIHNNNTLIISRMIYKPHDMVSINGQIRFGFNSHSCASLMPHQNSNWFANATSYPSLSTQQPHECNATTNRKHKPSQALERGTRVMPTPPTLEFQMQCKWKEAKYVDNFSLKLNKNHRRPYWCLIMFLEFVDVFLKTNSQSFLPTCLNFTYIHVIWNYGVQVGIILGPWLLCWCYIIIQIDLLMPHQTQA